MAYPSLQIDTLYFGVDLTSTCRHPSRLNWYWLVSSKFIFTAITTGENDYSRHHVPLGRLLEVNVHSHRGE
jgi:hypothetical protein